MEHTLTDANDQDIENARAHMIAALETALADVRAGRVVAVACVTVDRDGAHDPWWSTTDRCMHAGSVLRAAVAYLGSRMDYNAVVAVLSASRERDDRLS